MPMNRRDIIQWLREEDPSRLETLWAEADRVRRAHVGDAVHLRGLIELSNHCVRRCAYCGLFAGNAALPRYRMSEREILDCARQAVEFGYGTVVLQSGQDPGVTAEWMERVIRRIKDETPLAVTLSLGERRDDEFARWRRAGADRYLLRFETSDPALYARIHPSLPGERSDRLARLRRLRDLGYEIGGGVMVGLPGQTYDILARDIETFHALDLDMIGVGPYLPHPATSLAAEHRRRAGAPNQTPNTELMTYKVVALARLVCPDANIPSTTALATVNLEQGRELGLQRGANVVMPNLTPERYRALYEIYPNKACVNDAAAQCRVCLARRVRSIGRAIGVGRGDSPRLARLASRQERSVPCLPSPP